MAKNANKLLGDYLRLGNTKAFLNELSADMGIPISGLVQIVKGGAYQKISTLEYIYLCRYSIEYAKKPVL